MVLANEMLLFHAVKQESPASCTTLLFTKVGTYDYYCERERERARQHKLCKSCSLGSRKTGRERKRERELNRENAMYTGSLTTAFVLFAIIYVVVAATKRRATL